MPGCGGRILRGTVQSLRFEIGSLEGETVLEIYALRQAMQAHGVLSTVGVGLGICQTLRAQLGLWRSSAAGQPLLHEALEGITRADDDNQEEGS